MRLAPTPAAIRPPAADIGAGATWRPHGPPLLPPRLRCACPRNWLPSVSPSRAWGCRSGREIAVVRRRVRGCSGARDKSYLGASASATNTTRTACCWQCRASCGWPVQRGRRLATSLHSCSKCTSASTPQSNTATDTSLKQPRLSRRSRGPPCAEATPSQTSGTGSQIAQPRQPVSRGSLAC
jgi:hypothetical protein